MAKQRPLPEQLLRKIQEEERQAKRGKLKIYLGAAPGVGKTYEMLHDSLEERNKGLDVVVGIAESHGRHEIESLLENFEVLHRQKVNYRGKELLEFDLDAALKRDPGLILMDEMAHTNAPGLRHSKRWQDIKELLDRGINVYTTLNIQHIESLKDDVAQIIQAPIKETVPDSILDIADTIELVDLPPEELLKRLSEGKIYIPDQVGLAVEHFFKKGNLIALRELALRVTAEFVGSQVLLYRKGQKITRIWPTTQKILVCVGPGKGSLKLIRSARRMATSFQAEWIAVYVDSPKLKAPEEKRNNAIQNLHFAEQLGAETRILSGFDIVKEIMDFAHEENVTQIMICKHIRKRWRDLLSKSLVDEIVRHSQEIDVYIMTDEMDTDKINKNNFYNHKTPLKIYGISIGIILIVTSLNFLLSQILNTNNSIVLYFLGVTIVALFGELGPSIVASVLSVLIYYFFFTPSFYSFGISDVGYFLTLLVMIMMAYIVSHLTVLTRRLVTNARLIEHQTSALYTLSRQLASARGSDKLLDIGTGYISKIFNSNVVALIPDNSHLLVAGKDRGKVFLNDKEMSVAQWVYDLGEMAGLGTDTLSLSESLYVPLQGSQRVMGVLKIKPEKTEYLREPQQIRLLEACANQIALAVDVDRLHEQRRESELEKEIDHVRNALLQSVSHDLRAPLGAIMAKANHLIEMEDTLEKDKLHKIENDIYFEAEQLNRLISNLLQIAYLEAKSINLDRKLYYLQELIPHVIALSEKKLEKRTIQTELSDNLPPVLLDKALIEDVLINLIDNAIKFTPAESPIEIHVVVQTENNKLRVSIEDQGPGIVQDEVNRLFEKFYRGRMLSSERGLGLGLAICQKIILAHNGEIWAENRLEGGAAFLFTLPIYHTET